MGHRIGAGHDRFDTSAPFIVNRRDFEIDIIAFVDLHQISFGDLRFDLQMRKVHQYHDGKSGHHHIADMEVFLDDDAVAGGFDFEIVRDDADLFDFLGGIFDDRLHRVEHRLGMFRRDLQVFRPFVYIEGGVPHFLFTQ